ncbi:MAG: hypothetical protein WCI73_17790 [Phycisphaerae bacterium]
MKTLAAILTLAVLSLAACEKPADNTAIYDPKHDGVTPNALGQPVDKSILEPQNRTVAMATETPAPAPATTTAPATTAPAEATTTTAPAE